jgi:hypothetical protein
MDQKQDLCICDAKMSKKFCSHLKYWFKIHQILVYSLKQHYLHVTSQVKLGIIKCCNFRERGEPEYVFVKLIYHFPEAWGDTGQLHPKIDPVLGHQNIVMMPFNRGGAMASNFSDVPVA